MPQYYNTIRCRFLGVALLACWGLGAWCSSGTAVALTRTELYQTSVPWSDRSEPAQAAAFQAALKVVLVRVTGRRTAETDPAFAPLLGNARRYVQQYRGMPDNKLWVAFDGGAIERWLTQNGQPLWGYERPATLVLLSVPGPPAGTLLTAESTGDAKTAVDDAAAVRGIPLVWPTAADLAKYHLDYASLSATPAASLMDLARARAADAVLVGRAANAGSAGTTKWTFIFQERSSEVSGALEGINRAADTYAGLFAASGTLAPVDIEVAGINDVKDYANLQTYLESLTFVSRVSVQGLSGDSVQFRLSARGGTESLQRAFALSGKLQGLGATDNGIQRFQLRR